MPLAYRRRRVAALVLLLLGIVVALWSSQQARQVEPGPAAAPAPASTTAVATASQLADPPVDPMFGQRANTPLLRRVVEMYQWQESGQDSPLSYQLVWAEHPLPSQAYRQPQGHANPGQFPLNSDQFFAGVTQWQGRWLSHADVASLPAAPISPDPARLPQNLAASFSADGDSLVTSAHPGQPKPGDLRVHWTAVSWPPAALAAPAAASSAAAVAGPATQSAPHRWRPTAGYLLSVLLLLLAAGLYFGARRQL